MSEWDWNPYLVGGGTRPDAVTGLADPFEQSLQQMFLDAPPEVQEVLRVTSGYRSPEVQERLWQEALVKYGSPEAARKWVAPPGKSQHNHGSAVDLKYLSPAAQDWVHANAAKYGLHFPMAHEPWHIEPVGARSGQPGPTIANANALAAQQPAPAPGNALAAAEPEQWRYKPTVLSMPAMRQNLIAPPDYSQFKV